MNTNNGVKWRRFKVPKQIEHINDHLFSCTIITAATFVLDWVTTKEDHTRLRILASRRMTKRTMFY